MCVLTSNRCLVLNKSWNPVATVSLKRALIMLFSFHNNGEPKAKIIDHETFQTMSWDDWSKIKPSLTDEVIRSANLQFRIPEIILLTKYDKVPQPKLHFSRRTLYKRDEMTCQYCGNRPGSEELTIDHVTPRSQGGITSWDNCVLACFACNSKKANKTPEQAGMKLKSKPKKPNFNLFRYDTVKPVKSWSNFISEAYWNVKLSD